MKPTMFANLVSTSLYEKRFGPYFVTPIVVGVEDNKPVICTYDSIGAIDKDNFAGTIIFLSLNSFKLKKI